MSMTCVWCGNVSSEGTLDCPRCGIHLEWAAKNIAALCPACQAPNSGEAPRCSRCGLNIKQEKEERKSREATRARREIERLQGLNAAYQALLAAVVGFFFVGFVFGPLALYKTRQAQKYLVRGDPGWDTVNLAGFVAWIAIFLWIIILTAPLWTYLLTDVLRLPLV